MSTNKKYNPSEYTDRLDCGDRALNKVYSDGFAAGVKDGIKLACDVIAASTVGTSSTRKRLAEEILMRSTRNTGAAVK